MKMAKERQYQKKRKKNIKILLFSILTIFFVSFGFMFFTGDKIPSEDTLTKFSAVGTIPVGDSFIGLTNKIMNPKGQFFSFVDYSSNLAPISFQKIRESPHVYAKTPNLDWKVGSECRVGEVIVFKYCSNPNDRSTCTQNIFDEVWQVHRTGDYPNFKDFYTNDMNFYFAYVCYDPKMSFPDNFERKYLFNNACVNYKESNGRGTEYSTEKFCLDALQKIQEKERIEQQKLEAERQEKLRLDNLERQCRDNGGSFDRNRERCNYPTQTPSPSPSPSPSPEPNPEPDYNEDTNVDDTNYNDESTNTDSSNNTNDSKVTCKAYEVKENDSCSFSFKKIFTTNGFVEYWNENPLYVIFAIIMILILLVLFIPTKKVDKKRGNK